jgi:hypothetical protein
MLLKAKSSKECLSFPVFDSIDSYIEYISSIEMEYTSKVKG